MSDILAGIGRIRSLTGASEHNSRQSVKLPIAERLF